MDDNKSSFDSLGEGAERAGSALTELAHGQAVEAAGAIEETFARVGESIESSLTSAARAGELAFANMAQSILTSLANLAIERVIAGPLTSLLHGVFGGGFLGSRAEGGPVTSGGAYLVGERGPELFVPASAGAIEPSPTSSVAVHFHLGSDADVATLQRSQGQIAAMVARAVARGRKRL